MAHPTNNEVQAALLFSLIPEENNIIKIFGFLDLQSLGRTALVCKYFEKLQKNEALWTISLGSNPWDKCVLDLRKKTITTPTMGSEIHYTSAMNYPAIPKGSFVVYTYGTRCIPCAVIKNKAGLVKNIDDIRWENSNPSVIEFRNFKSQYIQIKSVVIDAKSLGADFLAMQDARVLELLKNSTESNQ
jgi:hypothetical protein